MIIDMEHGPTSFETAEEMIRAAESEDCTPLIRVGQNDELNILKALDIGAHGILVPHVENLEHAQAAVSCAKYYPLGNRGFSPFTRAGGYGRLQVKEHALHENEETLVGIILEGKTALENIEEILTMEQLDLIYIGAYDLSQAMGMPGQVDHVEVKKQLERCVRRIRSGGVAAGGYVAKNIDDIKWMTDIGMQFITCLPDVTMLLQAVHDEVSLFKKVINRAGGE